MKTFKDFGHQGDLNFRTVDSIPEGATDITDSLKDPARGGFTIALGEVSGHAHTIVGENVKIFEKEINCEIHKQKERRRFIKIVSSPAKLLHGTFTAPGEIKEIEADRHDIEILPVGITEQGFEVGYDPFLKQLKKVID